MSRNHAIWAGPLLTAFGGISYFLYFVRFPLLRDFPWVNLPLVLLGTAISLLGVWRAFDRKTAYRGRILASAGFVISLLVAGLFCAYIFAISDWLPEPTPTTLALAAAPELALNDHLGRPVQLADLRGSKVVIIFYRGHW